MNTHAPTSSASDRSSAKTTDQLGSNHQPILSHSIPTLSSPLRLQTKLTVNTPGDQYEQEADRVADQVMRMPEPSVQRQCSCGKSSGGGECDECKKKKKQSVGSIQRVATSSVGGNAAPPIVERVLSSPGSPLPESTRNYMECRFGQDFSHVRVHTDNEANESAAAVQARAYTVGNSIVFGRGESPTHNHYLTAHELTHVIQQTGSQNLESTPNVGNPSSVHTARNNKLQRTSTTSSPRAGHGMEAFVIGSGQVCLDLCTGKIELLGWLAWGAGKEIGNTFVGPIKAIEGSLGIAQLDFLRLLPCGTCDPACVSEQVEGKHLGPGVFPISKEFKVGTSITCGIIPTPRGVCAADIEVICLGNLLPLFPAVERPLSTVANILGADAEAGVDGSVSLGVCKDKSGKWVLDKSNACFGFYVEMGWGAAEHLKKKGKSPPPPANGPSKPQPSKPAPPKAPHDPPAASPELVS